jgi:hypothetical protein
VIGDAVLFNQGDEIGGRVACQGGFCEVWIRGKKIFRTAMNVGEVAAAAAGDENLFAQAVGALEDGDAASTFAGFDGAHKAGGASAKDQCIETMNHLKQGPGSNKGGYVGPIFPQGLKPFSFLLLPTRLEAAPFQTNLWI